MTNLKIKENTYILTILLILKKQGDICYISKKNKKIKRSKKTNKKKQNIKKTNSHKIKNSKRKFR